MSRMSDALNEAEKIDDPADRADALAEVDQAMRADLGIYDNISLDARNPAEAEMVLRMQGKHPNIMASDAKRLNTSMIKSVDRERLEAGTMTLADVHARRAANVFEDPATSGGFGTRFVGSDGLIYDVLTAENDPVTLYPAPDRKQALVELFKELGPKLDYAAAQAETSEETDGGGLLDLINPVSSAHAGPPARPPGTRIRRSKRMGGKTYPSAAGTRRVKRPAAVKKKNTYQSRVAARYAQMMREGHGPQRHDGGVSRQQLRDRVEKGIDPMTGTTTDGVTRRVHRVGKDATRIKKPRDFVQADTAIRRSSEFKTAMEKAKIARRDGFEVSIPLEKSLGKGYAAKIEGVSRIGSIKYPTGYAPTNFEGGNMLGVYRFSPNGDIRTHTMFPKVK